MRLYLQARVRSGRCSTPSEFIRTLIQEDEQSDAVHMRLAGLVERTISEKSNLTEADWASLQELLSQHFKNASAPDSTRRKPVIQRL